MGWIIILYGMVLLIVFAGPSSLALSPTTYPLMTLGHLFTFLASVVLFVLLGRTIKRHGRRPFWPVAVIGAVTAFAGTLISQYVIRLPAAEQAFIAQLHGVPVAAARTMLHLHVVSSALITGGFAAVFYGVLGGFAAWWGGRNVPKLPPPEAPARQDPKAS